jgi:hypothetical protein
LRAFLSAIIIGSVGTAIVLSKSYTARPIEVRIINIVRVVYILTPLIAYFRSFGFQSGHQNNKIGNEKRYKDKPVHILAPIKRVFTTMSLQRA